MNLIAWAACIDVHPDKLHLAAGVSISAARLNIIDCNGFGLASIFRGRCVYKQYEGRDALHISSKTGAKIVLITGGGMLVPSRKSRATLTAAFTSQKRMNATPIL